MRRCHCWLWCWASERNESAKPTRTYLGGNLTPASPKNSVLAYEPLADHEDEGAHFLFKDGTIKWLKTADAKRLIGQLEGGQNPPR